MNDLRDFNNARTSEMFIMRHNWWKPYYELTDGQFLYGRLSYNGVFKRYAIIESVEGTFTIKRKSLIGRNMLLNKGEEETIGEMIPSIWKRDVGIQMNNGFEANYLFKKLFSRAYTLTSNSYGDLLEIKQVPFGIKKPFAITFKNETYNTFKFDVPLLTMIGVHFMLYRQAQAAAAGAS
ncbi:hypothetical protein ACFQZX_12775 [Mucilaginibacter litoreus]|uniref:Tubby C 2 n=1 Tax=Mucilaginibacter litoreus TaxID=1048221 RepID=A0ABW3ATX5_9SPHI